MYELTLTFICVAATGQLMVILVMLRVSKFFLALEN